MDFKFLMPQDFALGRKILGSWRDPDFTISPSGTPYLYRWYIIPRNEISNIYFHIQVSDDFGREMHDHPYDNCSVILAGGYWEYFDRYPTSGTISNHISVPRNPGDVIFRPATAAHRLVLLDRPYSMSLFITGPKIRDWGFWTPNGFVPHEQWTVNEHGTSKLRNPS